MKCDSGTQALIADRGRLNLDGIDWAIAGGESERP